jgi:molybdopterin-biosynthesis enzyme MoeA-like protein
VERVEYVLILQTVDTNSTYFAKFCFNLGMSLKRIEVIADDEEEIVEATRRMSDKYDFVVTRQDSQYGQTQELG